jgi:hypothetical protein
MPVTPAMEETLRTAEARPVCRWASTRRGFTFCIIRKGPATFTA